MDCQCGFASAALNGDGNIRLCTETHPFALAGLLAGLVDHDRCEACAAELPTRPSVLVYFRDPPAIYAVAGMRLAEAGPDAFAERLKPLFAAAPAALPPEVLPDLDALRRRVAERLRTRLAVLDPLCEADTRNARHEYLPAHWREFTPAVFAAALVRLLGPLPGADLRLMVHKEPGSGPPTAADGVAALAGVQAHVWLMLAQSWMGLRHAARLEDDLDGYIDPGVLVAGATDRLFGYFDRLQENKNLFVLTRYGLEAIRATLCAAEGRANPHSRRWSNLLFGHEVFCEIGGDQVEPKHRVMRLPAERLRGTASFAEAWAEAADWLRFADQSGAKDRRGELVDRHSLIGG